MPGTGELDLTLQAQRQAWDRRGLLRRLYGSWYALIELELAPVAGPTVELGAGIGSFKEFHPASIATDGAPTVWSEAVVDAQELPYQSGSLANLVMIDVLHHLSHPLRALAEAERTLAPGGRLIMLEPYCSPVSTVAYRLFHHERTDMGADPFAGAGQSSEHPLDSNQALPTLIFWRHRDRFEALYPKLAVKLRRRLALLAYPLSGGFGKRQLLPERLFRSAQWLERLLAPAAPLLAFRCLVTLERRPD